MADEKVNHPAHYGGDTTYEAIKVIEAWGLSFCLGNTVKYICRSMHHFMQSDEPRTAKILEDLKKARWYLDREISKLESVIKIVPPNPLAPDPDADIRAGIKRMYGPGPAVTINT
jgi:hypothetical protein